MRYVREILIIALIAVPIVFFWKTELLFVYTGSNLTDGFFVYDGLQVWHLWMHLLSFVNCVAAVKLMGCKK